MSPAELRGLLGVVASGLAAFAEALPSGEAPRPDAGPDGPMDAAGWAPAFTVPPDPDLGIVTGSGLWPIDRPLIVAGRGAGLVHVRDVLRAELARLEAAMVRSPGDPGPDDAWRRTQPDCNVDAAATATGKPVTDPWQPEREDTFAELERIWIRQGMPARVRDLRIELGDGGFVCECCRRRWPASGWPYRCPLCSGALPGQACEACKSEGGGDTKPEAHTRRVLVWQDEADREWHREWRERPHAQWGAP